jgi:small subunit ribosomal protein S17
MEAVFMTEVKAIKRYKNKIGRVVSNKMDKTVVIAIERLVVHPRYSKKVKNTKKIYAHDKDNQCQIGDVVRVTEARPLSRLKRWRVTEILQRLK